jgi:hypothetical protein
LHAAGGSSKKFAAPRCLEPPPPTRTREGNSMTMAHHDNDDELLRSRAEGWRSFAHLLGWVITGAVIVLGLMALFLV